MGILAKVSVSTGSKLIVALGASTLAAGVAGAVSATVVTGSPNPAVWNEVRLQLSSCPDTASGAGLDQCMIAWRQGNLRYMLDRVDRSAEAKLSKTRSAGIAPGASGPGLQQAAGPAPVAGVAGASYGVTPQDSGAARSYPPPADPRAAGEASAEPAGSIPVAPVSPPPVPHAPPSTPRPTPRETPTPVPTPSSSPSGTPRPMPTLDPRYPYTVPTGYDLTTTLYLCRVAIGNAERTGIEANKQLAERSCEAAKTAAGG